MLTPPQVEQFLITLRNPRYYEPNERGPILLFGMFDGKELPFIASQTDPMEYGRKIYQKAVEGFYGKIGPFVPEEKKRSELPRTNFIQQINDLQEIVEALRGEIRELKGQS